MIKIEDNFTENVDSLDDLYTIFYAGGSYQFEFIPSKALNKSPLKIQKPLFDLIKEVIRVEPSFKAKGGYECWINVLTQEENHLPYHVDCDEDTPDDVVIAAKRTATIYLGPHEEIKGGDLVVNTQGLFHFNTFNKESIFDVKKDLDSGEWITIPYKYNRLILFDSELPHAVLPITEIPSCEARITLIIASWDKNIEVCR